MILYSKPMTKLNQHLRIMRFGDEVKQKLNLLKVQSTYQVEPIVIYFAKFRRMNHQRDLTCYKNR